MKKLIAFLSVAILLSIGLNQSVLAQVEQTNDPAAQEMVAANDSTLVTDSSVAEASTMLLEDEAPVKKTFHQVLKEKFIEGGAGFMAIVLLCLIFGLALSIERIIYLNLSTTNTTKLLNQVENAIETEGLQAAKEVCKNTRGPVAGIFFQGLDKYDEGIDMVEKSIVSYGGVLTGRLEKGLSWIALFIALAPNLGFMGTVIGMIAAFDNIAVVGDISPAVVADGIKVALLTTVFGLITAVILQIFYNYCVAKIDSLVNDMEDSTISLIDILSKNKK
ncbi:MAG: MotA/TolQ/ExbB proton channel family protein [Bacteroidales bacterium]|nr:MotA/TolQ/ExbB proton channel family protein [Bacteroidales bacterium]